jgi:hypothetical protein
MNFKSTLMAIILTMASQYTASAQGLNFAKTYEGKVIVSELAINSIQVDFSGDAARGMYEYLQKDPNVEKLQAKNIRGEIVEDVLRNSQVMCSSSLLFEKYFCQIRMTHD